MAWLRAPVHWRQERLDVLGRVYEVAVVARILLALHAIGVNLWIVMARAERPAIVVGAVVVIALWTVIASLALVPPSRRRRWLVLDGAMTMLVVLATAFAVEPGLAPLSLAGYWICGAPMYAAIFWSTWAALLSAGALSLSLVVVPSHFTMERAGMSFIICLVAVCVGVLIEQFRKTLEEQERERMTVAALAERERMSRIVHDGALQVLALVEREGPALGPVGVRLAALAKDSESKLRTHLQDRDVSEVASPALVDVAAALDKYSSADVTVSTMAGEVLAPRPVVAEMEATVQEILLNVERHAGEGAQTWILLDQERQGEVILWVRDNGKGMDAAHARKAASEGRFGIRDSIIGRITAIGGSAVLKSAPGAGTEWELRIPIEVE